MGVQVYAKKRTQRISYLPNRVPGRCETWKASRSHRSSGVGVTVSNPVADSCGPFPGKRWTLPSIDTKCVLKQHMLSCTVINRSAATVQSLNWVLFNRHLLAGASCGFTMGCKQASGTDAQPSCKMQHEASAAAVGKSNAAAPGSWMPNDLRMHTCGHEHLWPKNKYACIRQALWSSSVQATTCLADRAAPRRPRNPGQPALAACQLPRQRLAVGAQPSTPACVRRASAAHPGSP